jgi:DNA-binding transcriptional LysR family regulator
MSLLSPQLEAFIAVVKYKTVHAAADSIHLTQTAVTQRIRSLERILKTTLFIRTRRGMLLTKEGEALLRYCLASKELEGAALAKIQGAGIESEVELSISAPTSIMHSRIIPACVSIMKQYPNLLIQFDVNDNDTRHQKLRSAQTDFAIIQEQELAEEMEYKKLQPEQYVLVASSKWKGRKLSDIIKNERIIDFDQSDQITLNYLKQYNLLDSAKHSRYFVNRTDNLALLVAEGIGYTTLAKEFAQPYIANKQLITLNRALPYDITPILAWYERHEPPAYFAAIIKAIK